MIPSHVPKSKARANAPPPAPQNKKRVHILSVSRRPGPLVKRRTGAEGEKSSRSWTKKGGARSGTMISSKKSRDKGKDGGDGDNALEPASVSLAP